MAKCARHRPRSHRRPRNRQPRPDQPLGPRAITPSQLTVSAVEPAKHGSDSQPLTEHSQPRSQGSPEHRNLHPNRTPICLVHLKIARDAPRLLGFAIYVWTIPAQVVQIYIAISASAASGRVERLQRAEPGPSSGVVPAAPFVGPNGRGLRSAWHVVAIMRRRGAFMAGLSSFGCGGPGWSSISNADATSRQPPAEEPHSSQRSNNARIRASPRGALRAGSRTSGRKSARSARPVCARRYKITSARKSLTLVCVGPVTSRSPIASK